MSLNNNIYLLGSSVDNSLSDSLHLTLYDYLGLPFKYIKKSILTKKELDQFVSKLVSENFFAANITFPYKNYIYKKFHSNAKCDAYSNVTKGLNLFCGPELSLYNFDGLGMKYFLNHLGILDKHKHICVFGSGATARSIALALSSVVDIDITLLTRSFKNKEHLTKIFSNTNYNIKAELYDRAKDAISGSQILIDATPIFFFSEKTNPVIQNYLEFTNKNQILIDVSYKNNQNALLDYDKLFNSYFDGRGMLICQAILCIRQICKNYNICCDKIKNYDDMFKLASNALNLNLEEI